VRFGNKNIFFYLEKKLKPTYCSVGVVVVNVELVGLGPGMPKYVCRHVVHTIGWYFSTQEIFRISDFRENESD
jgi:hypothetical protein